jgi:hypothetical protein
VCLLLWPSALLDFLVIIARPCGFTSDSMPSSFMLFAKQWSSKADPTPRLVFICKISPIVGMILTLELREWSCLPSCRWDQRSGSLDCSSFSDELSSFVILGWDSFRGKGCNTLVLLYLLQYIYSENLIQADFKFKFELFWIFLFKPLPLVKELYFFAYMWVNLIS